MSAFIEEAISAKELLILMIDDYTNIHTKRRPKNQETSTARSMATILLKRFHGVQAIPAQCSINPDGVSTDLLIDYTVSSLSSLSATYASVMPHWIRLSFFDPEMDFNIVFSM